MQVNLKTRSAVVFAIVATATLALGAPAQAKRVPGLDTTFGNHGIALSAPTPKRAYSWNLAAGAGRIIASYESTREKPLKSTIVLAAFDDAGNPIRSFGRSGVIRYGGDTWLGDYTATVDSQGRVLLLVGAIRSGNFYLQRLELVRFTIGGNVDSTFNGGKPLSLDRGDEFSDASLKVTPSGRIFVYNGGLNVDPVVYSVNDAGQLDQTFGSAGRATMPADDPFPDPDTLLDQLDTSWSFDAVADDGSIFMTTQHAAGKVNFPGVGKTSSFVPWILKFTPSGQRDSSFGANGLLAIKRTEPEGIPLAVGVDPDGAISTALFLRQPRPPKGRKSKPTEIVQRFDAAGLARPATLTGQPEVPLPLTKLHEDTEQDKYRFNADGSIERLTYGNGRYELTSSGPGGMAVVRHAIIKLPKSMSQFDEAVLSPTDHDSFLVGGGAGKRIAVIRIRPTH